MGLILIVLLAIVPTAGLAQNLLSNAWMYYPVTLTSAVRYSSDGKLLVVGGNGGAQVYSTATNALIACLPSSATQINAIAFSPDGKTLAVGGSGGYGGVPAGVAEIWNVSNLTLTRKLATSEQFVNSIAFSPDGATVVVGGYNSDSSTSPSTGALEIWNVSDGTLTTTLATDSYQVNAVAISPDGTTIAVGCNGISDVLQLWSLSSNKLLGTLSTAAGDVQAVTFSPDGKTLAVGGTHNNAQTSAFTGVLELWSPATQKLTASLQTAGETVYSVAVSPDGKTLAAGTYTASLYVGATELWNLRTGNPVTTLTTAGNPGINCAVFSPNGERLAHCGISYNTTTGQTSSELDIWEMSSETLAATLNPASGGSPSAVAFSPDGKTVAEGGSLPAMGTQDSTGLLTLRNAATGAVTAKFNTAAELGVSAVSFSPDGTMIADGAISSNGSFVEVWSVSTGKTLATLQTAANFNIGSVLFSSDGSKIAIAGTSESGSANIIAPVLEIWDAAAGKRLRTIESDANVTLNSISFSPDGTKLAVGGIGSFNSYDYGVAEVWTVADGTLFEAFGTGEFNVDSVAFSPDGKTVAVGGLDYIAANNSSVSALELWTVATAERETTLPVIPTSGTLGCLVFTPDGRALFVGSIGQLQVFGTANFGLLDSFAMTSVGSISFNTTGSDFAYSTGGIDRIAVAQNPFFSTTAVADLKLSSKSVIGGNSVTGSVTLGKTAPIGGTDVLLTSSSAYATVPSTVTVPAGSQSATFTISTGGVGSAITATISATGSGPAETASLGIMPATLTSVALSPSSVTGGTSATGTVTLNGFAGAQGTVVSLSSSNGAVQVPSSTTVLEGKNTAAFVINTGSVAKQTTAVITVKCGSITKTATLTIGIVTPQSVALNPSTVVGGSQSIATITLSGPAPAGGLAVKVTSSSNVATVPASVLVAAGVDSATFEINTIPVSSQKAVTLTVKLNGASQTASLAVSPPSLLGISVNPSTVKGGISSNGTVSITAPAPPGGMVITLSSDQTCAIVPKSLTIPAGKTFANFTIKTKAVKSTTVATITSTLGSYSQTAVLTVN